MKSMNKCESAVSFISVCFVPSVLCSHSLSLAVLTVLVSVCITDNQECGDNWREDEDKLPGHENLTEKDVELFRHIQELALQVQKRRGKHHSILSYKCKLLSHLNLINNL